MPSTPASLRHCLADIAAATHEDAQHLASRSWAPVLARDSAVAGPLIREVARLPDNADAPTETPVTDLFAAVLDDARCADEDDSHYGTEFLAAARAEIDALQPATVTPVGVRALIQAHARARLETPAALTTLHEAMSTPDPELDTADVDELLARLRTHLDTLFDQVDGNLQHARHAMAELLAAYPAAARHALIEQVAAWPDPRWQALTLHWLLDPDPAIRAIVATAWRRHAEQATVTGPIAAQLPLVRSWLPADPARADVDATLEHLRRRADLPALPEPDTIERIIASLPDGAGAQSMCLQLRQPGGGGRRWALVLIKAGFGVRDAFVLAGDDEDRDRELVENMQAHIDCFSVNRSTLDTLVAMAIGESLAGGAPPASGLIDVALAAGLHDLRPQPCSEQDLRAAADPDAALERLSAQKRGRLINRSARWWETMITPVTWFEDNRTTADILAHTAGRPRVRDRGLRAQLETRRDWWGALCLRGAIVLRGAGIDPELARSFAATGAAILDGRDLRKIPIMEQIRQASIDAAAMPAPADADDFVIGEPTAFSQTQRRTLEAFFDDSEGSLHWPAGYFGVHGFLFAIATHPELIQPSHWLPLLLGDPDQPGISGFASMEEANELLAALFSLYNTIGESVRAVEPTLPDDCDLREPARENFWPQGPVGQWAHGFRAACEAFGHISDALHDQYGPDSDRAAAGSDVGLTLEGFADAERIRAALRDSDAPDTPSFDLAAEVLAANFHDCLRECARLALELRMEGEPAPPPPPPTAPPQPMRSEKIGRNAPCPCGSGRKYKRCCSDTRRR